MGQETGWPVAFHGVTESLVTTLGPNGRWNAAPLGLHPSEAGPGSKAADADAVTARTWGETRTRRNFRVESAGYVQFTRDPVAFVEAALSIVEIDDPVLPAADAWARVAVERIAIGSEGETSWADWVVRPEDYEILRRTVPTTNRGYAAVVEASVAASRLDVEAYDTEELLDRIAYFETVVERCGDRRDVRALALVRSRAEEYR